MMAEDSSLTPREETDVPLLPCPFCGAKEGDKSFPALFDSDESGPSFRWHVYCWECGGQGDSKPTAEEAIAAWNRRAPATRGEANP
jgi:Lar family restriction alleviation protein